jgi:hypothetical protein
MTSNIGDGVASYFCLFLNVFNGLHSLCVHSVGESKDFQPIGQALCDLIVELIVGDWLQGS